MLGDRSSYFDTKNVRIQFQQKGVVESLGDQEGVIKSDVGIRYSFKASDLHFDAGLEHDIHGRHRAADAPAEDAGTVRHAPYNCAWCDLSVGLSVYYIPFRSRGLLKKGSQASPALPRALSITLHERVITCRVGILHNIPQGVIAIPKWMWPSLCPLTAAESGEGASAASVLASPARASAANEPPDADQTRLHFALDGLRDRTVRVTTVFSSRLPVVTGARAHCISKRSLDPSILAPNFTDLTNWLATLNFLVGCGVRVPPRNYDACGLLLTSLQIVKDPDDPDAPVGTRLKSGFFSLTAGGRIVVTYCGFV
jgi:hypothetical protein